MVRHYKKGATVRVQNFEHAIFANLNYGVSFWVRLLVDCEAHHLVFDDPSAQVSFTHDTKVICSSPDASTMVSGCDGSVRVVNDLVAVSQLANDLSLSRHDAVSLLELILRVVAQDRVLLSNHTVAH